MTFSGSSNPLHLFFHSACFLAHGSYSPSTRGHGGRCGPKGKELLSGQVFSPRAPKPRKFIDAIAEDFTAKDRGCDITPPMGGASFSPIGRFGMLPFGGEMSSNAMMRWLVDRAGFEPATFRFCGLVCLANRTFFGPFLDMAYQAELPARPLPYNAQIENNHYGREPSPCA